MKNTYRTLIEQRTTDTWIKQNTFYCVVILENKPFIL